MMAEIEEEMARAAALAAFQQKLEMKELLLQNQLLLINLS
jgi:hypothetical protein